METTQVSNSNSRGLARWLRDNSWNLIITAWMVGTAILYSQFRISAVEKAQAQLEKNLGEYPSVDYFNEKFKNIDDKFTEMNSNFKDLQKDFNNYVQNK